MGRSHAYTAILLVSASAALIAGCGGGSQQDAGEPHRVYTVAITHASFPAHQAIVRPTTMTVAVRNTSDTTMPNVAVSVNSFDYTSHYPGLADDKKPIWVVETGPGAVPQERVPSEEISPPGGGQTAYVSTWALGPLAPGGTRTFTWHLMPIKSGDYTVNYTVAAGLAGRSRALLADGSTPRGRFHVTIIQPPPATHINPSTGRVQPGSYQSTLSGAS